MPTERTLPVNLLCAAVVAGVLFSFAGCVAPGRVANLDSELDSLRTSNLALTVERDKLADSLAYIGYVSSGEMDRDVRRLTYEVDRLTYDLASCREGGEVVGRLLVDDIFEPASARLTARGRSRIDSVLASMLTDDTRHFAVVGHSDSSLPGETLSRTYPTNWELAGARAAAVVRHLIDNAGVDTKVISAVSHGDAHPEYSNGTAEGRRRNRRIEFLRR